MIPRLISHCLVASGLHPELLNNQMLSVSPDTLAVLEAGAAGGHSTVRLFDSSMGRPIGEPLKHHTEIKEIALSQVCV
jgi:hypothetical protein